VTLHYRRLLEDATRALQESATGVHSSYARALEGLHGFTDLAAAIQDRLRTQCEGISHLYDDATVALDFAGAFQGQVRALSESFLSARDFTRDAAARLSEAVERFIAGPQFVQEANQEIRRLSERGRMRDAWVIARWASAKRRDSELLARWAEVLKPTPARAAGPATGRPRRREESWLRRHAREYQGQWVALLGDRLIAASPRFSEVRQSVRAVGCASDVLLHFIPRVTSA